MKQSLASAAATNLVGARVWRAAAMAAVALAATLVVLTLVMATEARAEFGFVPGSTVAKTHEPIAPLVVCGFAPAGFLSSQDCALDKAAIDAAPHTSQAGDHPDGSAAANFIKGAGERLVGGVARDLIVDAPPGFVGSPTAVTECPRELFAETGAGSNAPAEEQCPPSSQVGVLQVFPTSAPAGGGNTGWYTIPMYRLTPRPGFPASFGFKALSDDVPIVVNANVRTDGDYGVSILSENITTQFALRELRAATLFGVPGRALHDDDRWNPFKPFVSGGFTFIGDWGGSAGIAPVPLLQTPADCSNGDLVTKVRVRSWQEPDKWLPEHPLDPTYAIPTPQPTGCELLRFEPSFAFQPTNRDADSATGGKVTLRVPQNEDPDGLSTPPLRKAVVTLPEGVSVNPAAADGQLGCTSEQIGLLTTHGAYPNPIRFAKGDGSCPEAAKIGTAVVTTPALDDPVPADVYLAQPYDNPFRSLLAVYLVVRGPGFTAKLPGLVEADPDTGRLTTTVDHSPQLPVEQVELNLFTGSRAPLATPRTCGVKATVTSLTPWSAPQSGPAATPTTSFVVDDGPAGGCSPTLASRPFAPDLSAGATNPVAGEFSPLTMRLARGGGHQEPEGLTVRPPAGFLASLAGVPYCSEDAIAIAATRTGRYTADHGDCRAESQIGRVLAGAGAGPAPYFVGGKAYLAGPYEGAPLSMVAVVPTLAGGTAGSEPFDLGTVVVRVALHVNRRSAQVTAISDPLPQILEGIPLRLRDARVVLDRPDFGLNPSSCEEKSFDVDATGASGAKAALSDRFQVIECAGLDFKPRLAMALTGPQQTKTGKHPGIRAQVNQTGVGEAGIEKAVVRLPKSLALDPDNAQALCEFEDGTRDDLERHCPKGSIVGRARAVTPLLDEPLAGNVYFVKNVRLDKRTGNKIRTLPMIVVALRGQVPINLYGKSSTTKAGKLVNTFADVPDAPITRFNLNIKGGKNGILAVTRTRRSMIHLCAGLHVAEADMDGQNGKKHDFDIRMKTPCTKRQAKAARRQARRAAAKARAGSERR